MMSLQTRPELPTVLGLDLAPEPPRIRVVRLQPWPVPFPACQEARGFQGLADVQAYWRSLALLPTRPPRLVVAAALEAHDPDGILPWLEAQGALVWRYPAPYLRSYTTRGHRRRHLPLFAWNAYALAHRAAYLCRAPEHLERMGHELRRARSLLDELTNQLRCLTESLQLEPGIQARLLGAEGLTPRAEDASTPMSTLAPESRAVGR